MIKFSLEQAGCRANNDRLDFTQRRRLISGRRRILGSRRIDKQRFSVGTRDSSYGWYNGTSSTFMNSKFLNMDWDFPFTNH
jgi:hypothetical protein